MLTWRFGRKSAIRNHLAERQRLEAGLTREMEHVLAHRGVPTFRQAQPELSAELDRARRYGRCLAVLAVSDARITDGHAWLMTHGNGDDAAPGDSAPSPLTPGSALITAIIGSVLRDVVREADIVAYAPTLGRCLVVMPEVGASEAPQAVSRVGGVCASRLMFPIRAGIALFPTHGWTLDDLIRHAEESEVDAQPEALPAEARSRRVV